MYVFYAQKLENLHIYWCNLYFLLIFVQEKGN
jgi:hypothetical protein